MKPSPEFVALNRATFGATPDELSRMQKMGWPAWVDEQLQPAKEDAEADQLFSMVTGLVFGVFLWTKARHAEDKPDFQSDLTQFKPQDYQRPFAPRAPWNLPLQGIPHHPESGLWAERLWRLSTAARPGNFNLGGFENYSYSVYLADEATAFVPGQGAASGLRQPARKGSAVDAITKKTAADYKTQTGVDAAIFASSATAGATVIKG